QPSRRNVLFTSQGRVGQTVGDGTQRHPRADRARNVVGARLFLGADDAAQQLVGGMGEIVFFGGVGVRRAHGHIVDGLAFQRGAGGGTAIGPADQAETAGRAESQVGAEIGVRLEVALRGVRTGGVARGRLGRV